MWGGSAMAQPTVGEVGTVAAIAAVVGGFLEWCRRLVLAMIRSHKARWAKMEEDMKALDTRTAREIVILREDFDRRHAAHVQATNDALIKVNDKLDEMRDVMATNDDIKRSEGKIDQVLLGMANFNNRR